MRECFGKNRWATKEPIVTKGGMTVVPEINVDEMTSEPSTVLSRLTGWFI